MCPVVAWNLPLAPGERNQIPAFSWRGVRGPLAVLESLLGSMRSDIVALEAMRSSDKTRRGFLPNASSCLAASQITSLFTCRS
ncbi:hypothetical protein M8J77_023201 [Diaphorina citri]|nr:hypothetical protein M8J77_023201 [Diaphorina citri]